MSDYITENSIICIKRVDMSPSLAQGTRSKTQAADRARSFFYRLRRRNPIQYYCPDAAFHRSEIRRVIVANLHSLHINARHCDSCRPALGSAIR